MIWRNQKVLNYFVFGFGKVKKSFKPEAKVSRTKINEDL